MFKKCEKHILYSLYVYIYSKQKFVKRFFHKSKLDQNNVFNVFLGLRRLVA